MLIGVSIVVLIVFYFLPIKEDDAIDRIRNYGVIISVIGFISLGIVKLFGGPVIIPRYFDMNVYETSAAEQILLYFLVFGLFQVALGLILRAYIKRS